MTISFNSIPGNIRVPFVAAEIDNSRASQGPAGLAYRVLLIGQKTTAGTATADTLRRVTSADQVRALAGPGSQLHRQARAYFANNTSTETWVGVLGDNASGVAASGTITITGTATAAGVLSTYVGDTRVQVGVAVGDTGAAVATALAAALPSVSDLPVTGAAASGVVTVTARNKGPCGNDIGLRLNHQDGEVTPAGLTVAVVPMASGAGNPSLSALIAAMGDTWFHVLTHPYTDATSLTAIEAELSSRFGPMRMIDGVAVTSASGSHSTLATLGGTRNSQHSLIVAQPGEKPLTPPCDFAAAVAGVLALAASIDPARPLQTLPLAGVAPPAQTDEFTLQERNLLLYDGIATTRVQAGGVVALERLITTYRTNAAGAPDTSYLDVTTLLTLAYLRYSFRTQIQTRYPRHKLANDGARRAPGQAVITPSIGRAEAVLWFRAMEELGLVEGFDQFKRDLVVERSTTDANRLDFLLPPDLINQFIVGAVQIQFRA